MGLKGAASYFKRMTASVVLASLLYSIVELYLDDVLVYATSEDELIERSRTVFIRHREFNITLNPKKCSFGMEEVEFVKTATFSRPTASTSHLKREAKYWTFLSREAEAS